MSGLTEPHLQQPYMLRGAIAAGLAVGALRGWLIAVEIDPLWSTVRLPGGGDGLAMGILLATILLLTIIAPLVSSHSDTYVPYGTAAVAFGAGYLCARAMAVYLRSRG